MTLQRTGYHTSQTRTAEYVDLTQILDYRNVWIVYPRNFGNSDHIDSFDDEAMGNDVLRFMYEHKMSTACLAGHGVGGLIALKAATRNIQRFTGYVGLDCAPVDYNNYDVFQEVKQWVNNMSTINLSKPRASILNDINEGVNVDELSSRTPSGSMFSDKVWSSMRRQTTTGTST